MKCEKCGSELKDGMRFCQECGAQLQQVEDKTTMKYEEYGKDEQHSKGKKVKKKKKGCAVIVIALVILGILGILMIGGSSSGGSDETIEKLQEIATLSEEEDIYVFTGATDEGDNWALRYTDVSTAIRFEDDAVAEYISWNFGEDTLHNNGFTYNLGESMINIYLEAELEEGKLSIISYDVKADSFTLMIDGNEYYASEEFEEDIRLEILDVMIKDIDDFENQLEENGIEIDEVKNLGYSTLGKYL